MREIEIKLKVGNIDELEKKLTGAGCIFSQPISQHDTVYTYDNSISFQEAKEGHIAIRIRHEDDKFQLNLKQQRSNQLDNIEYETEVKDANEVHQMLLVLGWKPETEVKKIRKKAKMGEYEICLDRVEKLGDYIELEKMADENANPEEVRKELFEILKPFGLSEKDEEINGYDILICKLKNQ
jgi:adenylate cyclase class 2